MGFKKKKTELKSLIRKIEDIVHDLDEAKTDFQLNRNNFAFSNEEKEKVKNIDKSLEDFKSYDEFIEEINFSTFHRYKKTIKDIALFLKRHSELSIQSNQNTIDKIFDLHTRILDSLKLLRQEFNSSRGSAR